MTHPRRKIIVIDDDPTGSQTVHGCLLITSWDIASLRSALLDKSPLLFVLSNTRSLGATEAASIMREIAENLKSALHLCAKEGRKFSTIWVSRSDSTLRGHFPLETDIIEEIAGPFDRLLLIPAFIQGGRITVNGIHYLVDNSGTKIPVAETEFAKDSVFGYTHSFLPKYVEEKTQGRVSSFHVSIINVRSIHGRPDFLDNLHTRIACIDAETHSDLDKVGRAIWDAAERSGQRLLLRCGAGIVASLASLPPQPVASSEFNKFRRNNNPGVFIVGSHVSKTTQQITRLQKLDSIESVEIDVSKIQSSGDEIFQKTKSKIDSAYRAGRTPLVFTSRQELSFESESKRLHFGTSVSAFLTEVTRSLPKGISYLVSKGGITSNDILSKALDLKASRLLGQIITGCSVVRCPSNHPTFPKLPVVIFPGNVGDENGLVDVFCRFENQPPCSSTNCPNPNEKAPPQYSESE